MLRNVSTFILEILPYALASLIGAFLLAGHLGGLPARGEAKPPSAVATELVRVSTAPPAPTGYVP
ncbi:MAG: hypothetical protein ABSG76_06355 [Xanthobacteraceae bacterium]|jgi:hypothetical protein